MGGLFHTPEPYVPPVITIPEPTIMPVPDSELARKARKKSIARQQRRGGREATILTDKMGA